MPGKKLRKKGAIFHPARVLIIHDARPCEIFHSLQRSARGIIPQASEKAGRSSRRAQNARPYSTMKLFFLGTGAAEGVPALFCDCDVCRAAHRRGGNDKRTRTSVLVDDAIQIDLSPDTLAHVHRYGPDFPLHAVRDLLFTHSHDDHFAVRELQYLSPTFAPTRTAPLHVWGSSQLLDKLKTQTSHFFETAPLGRCTLTPFVETAVAHLLVTPIVARHSEAELCFNYLLRNPQTGATLLYATDTGWYAEPTWAFLEGRRLDAVVVECGNGGAEGGYEGHLNVSDVIRFREKLHAGGGLIPNAPFYATHLSHTGLLLHDELTERFAPHGIRVAHDGLTLAIS